MERIRVTVTAAILVITGMAGCASVDNPDQQSTSDSRPHYDTVTTFLMFEGDAEEAIEFYISLFDDSKITRIERYGPDTPGPEGKVLHAAFTLGGRPFIAFDSPQPHPFGFTPAISLFIFCENEAEFDRLYESLAEGGQVLMPPGDYGFSPRYAWVNDRFGVSWQINLGGIEFDSAKQMDADLEQLAGAIRSDWSYYEDRTANNGLDLDALLADAREPVQSAISHDDFQTIVTELVAELWDGHGGVQRPGETRLLGRWPIQIGQCAEGIVITAVAAAEETAARQRVPRPGDLLISVNGEPIEAIIEQVRRESMGSTPQGRRAAAMSRAVRTNETGVVLVCETRSANEPERYETRLPTIGIHERIAPPETNWELSWPRPAVAMLRITTFAIADWQRWLEAQVEERDGLLRETYEQIDALFEEIQAGGAEALVLDLRGNAGGTDLLGIHVARQLLPREFVYTRLSSKIEGDWTPPGGMPYQPVANRFAGRVVALTDARCFSTTDNFLRCLRDLHPDFTVIGRATGGGTGAPRAIVTLNHSRLQVTLCTMRVYGPTSGLIEGRGTTPDIAVQWSAADWAAGRDPDLEAAMEFLEQDPAS